MDKHIKIRYRSDKKITPRNAAKTAMLMAVLMLGSKLIGFIREMITANFFGTSYIVDAYVMSTALPSIIFGGGFSAIATAYMPIFSKISEDSGKIKGDKFTSSVINLLLAVSILASATGFLLSDQLVAIFASGFTGETARLTSYFVKITFTYTLFTSTAGIIDSYLQYRGIFLYQIIAGYAQNIMIIIFIIISAFTSFYLLAFGMLIGVICRLLLVSVVAKKQKYKHSLIFNMEGSVKKIALLAMPVFIGSSMQQISTFVDKTLASGLPEGSVSALNYAMLLIVLITSLTTGIFATIVYPKLSQANSLEDYDRLSGIFSTGFSMILIIAIPFALGAIIYGSQVVQIVYERGAFDPIATTMTTIAFKYYAVGLIFMALNDLLIRTYYSMHDMKLPMIFAGVGVIVDIILNLILVRYMAHGGLALASSIGFMVNTILLVIGMRIKYHQIRIIKSFRYILKIIISAMIAVGVSWLFYHYIIMSLREIIVARILQLVATVIVAAIVYFIMLFFFKIEEIKIAKQLLKS